MLGLRVPARRSRSAIKLGARGYLLKECALKDLVPAIHAVSAGQIYVSPGLADTVMDGYGTEGSESSAHTAWPASRSSRSEKA